MTDPADDFRPDDAAEALTEEQALRLLLLERDGRPVEAEALRRARALAAERPALRAQLADFAALSEVLADEPPVRPGADFTERVLAARARPDPAAGRVLRLARRLSVAAALLLVVAVGSDLASPERAVADPDIEDQPHAVDEFGADPFAPDDLDAGLRGLLPDPARRASDAARRARLVDARDAADGDGAEPGDHAADDDG